MAPKPAYDGFAVIDSDYVAFYASNIIGLCMLGSSFVSASWMISSIIRNKKYNSIGDRFPLYLAVCDIGFIICHTVDHTYLLATKQFPDRWLCSLLGACLQLWLGSGITMAALASITVYLRVYREYQVNWGSYEWEFLTLAYGLNIACIVVGFAVGNVFGASKFWCYISTGTREGAICNVLFNTVPVTTSFAICAFCYGMVYRKIVMHSRQMRDAASVGPDGPRLARLKEHEVDTNSEIVKTAPLACGRHVETKSSTGFTSAASRVRRNRPIIKMMTYIAGYFVQWFVAVILALTMLTNNDETVLYIGTILTVNAGGTIHALSYWYNNRADKQPGLSGSCLTDRSQSNIQRYSSATVTQNVFGEVDERGRL